MEGLEENIKKIMESNRRGGEHEYTLPSPELYPFEWLWDSCFHAIILSKFDLTAAKNEFRSMVSRPLPSGLIPHIIYWEKLTKDASWGREMRGDVIDAAWGTTNTSSITQPPLMAETLWHLYMCSEEDVTFLREMYPVLRSHYAYLLRERTYSIRNLAYMINPDESGEDNSPRFDSAQGLGVVHSTEENLERRLERMRQNAVCDFDSRTCMSLHFAVADVSFNVLLAESLGALQKIAEVLGFESDEMYFGEQKLMTEKAMRQLLHTENGEFYSYDNLKEEHILIKTWNLFMPLYGGLVTKEEAKHLVSDLLLNEKEFGTEWPVPSVSQSEPSFDPQQGFWRGPVWMAPNWFIYKGLKRYGFDSEAKELKKKTITLLENSGFREHYDPLTGKGLGAKNFTWGGLVLDMD